MGLYDTVHLEILDSLPAFPDDPQDHGWQTKTIGRPGLQTYRICNGRLEKRTREYEEHGVRELWTDENGDSVTVPDREIVDEWWEDQHYHGTIEIHTIVYEEGFSLNDDGTMTTATESGSEYFSYEARFTRGVIQEIEHLEGGDCTNETISFEYETPPDDRVQISRADLENVRDAVADLRDELDYFGTEPVSERTAQIRFQRLTRDLEKYVCDPLDDVLTDNDERE